MIRILIALFVMLPLALAVPVAAEGLPAPKGEVALTVSGGGSDVTLDLDMIKSLGSETITTTTDWDWHDGEQNFAGTPALKLLEAAGIDGDKITIVAADEYAVTMTLDDLKKHNAVIATSLNGEDLTDDSFGPLWLVFPYDEMASAEREAYTARSVWSIVKISVQ